MPEAVRRSLWVVAEEFNHYRDEARENGWEDRIGCADNPGPYADWTTPPTEVAAEALCEGCPLRALCREYGDVSKPGWGVWGGKVWMYKRSIYGPGSPGWDASEEYLDESEAA